MAKDPLSLIDASLLKVVAPKNKELELWVEPIVDACHRFNIDTVREVACFLSQGSHESAGFTRLVENLNYSATRLTQVWPKRFPNLGIANQYANNPEKLANFVYANRMGNGPAVSGDGWNFRGRGIFQLTGRDNYTRFARDISMSPLTATKYIETRAGAAMSAAWFFNDRDLQRLAATPGVEDETQAINGGFNGLAERKKLFDATVTALLKRGA